jgi:L-ascorbate metabolism protein UlaG (beta-lactamase superfamily)
VQEVFVQSHVPRIAAIVLVAGMAALSLAQALGAEASATDVRIVYAGNEGFLVDVGGTKILFDALYRTGVPGYAVHTKELQNQIELGQEPFDGVSLVLVSHVHSDHFDPIAVGKFMLRNPNATLVTTPQTVDLLQKNFRGYSAISTRVRGLFPREGEPMDVPLDGLSLTAMAMHHGRNVPFQNLGFLVEVNGVKLLHLGDSEATHAELGRYTLAAQGIDVAFVPFWYLLDVDGVKLVREAISPKKVVPMHIPVEGAPATLYGDARTRDGLMKLMKTTPGAVVFDSALESRDVSLDED